LTDILLLHFFRLRIFITMRNQMHLLEIWNKPPLKPLVELTNGKYWTCRDTVVICGYWGFERAEKLSPNLTCASDMYKHWKLLVKLMETVHNI